MKRILMLWLGWLASGIVVASIPPDVRDVLHRAGANERGLTALLKKYDKKATDEQFRAACYLIKNAALHKRHFRLVAYDKRLSEWTRSADSAYYALTAGWAENDWQNGNCRQQLDTLAFRFKANIEPIKLSPTRLASFERRDIEWIDSAFLARHLDHVFLLRKKHPRVKALSWEMFRDMVLPYASLPFTMRPEPFETYEARFGKYLQTVTSAAPADIAARYARYVTETMRFLPTYPVKGDVGMDAVPYYGAHDCVHMAYHAANAFRACGIPALIGFNSMYKVRNGNHFHVGMPDEKGNWYTFTLDDGEARMHDAKFRLSTNIFYLYDGMRKNNPYSLRAKGEYIPGNLADSCMEDHTDRVTRTVRLTLPCRSAGANRLAYLAAYHSDYGFLPVTWGLIDHKKQCVTFEKVVPDNLYFPVCCVGDDAYKAFGSPFWIASDSTDVRGFRIDSLLAGDKREVQIKPVRVAPWSAEMEQLQKAIDGMVVLASEYRDFRDADTLGRIVAAPNDGWQILDLKNTRPYRYYKVETPEKDRHFHLAEVEFLTIDAWSYENVMRTTPGLKVAEHSVRLLAEPLDAIKQRSEYDGNVATAPESYPTLYFFLKKPQVVTHFCYRVRSDGRSTAYGEKCRLYAWGDRGWELAHTFLVLDEVPSVRVKTNTLYCLHREGYNKEEYPFVVTDEGEQVFVHRQLLTD